MVAEGVLQILRGDTNMTSLVKCFWKKATKEGDSPVGERGYNSIVIILE